MELIDAIYQRRAVRNYTDATVAAALLNDLFKAAVQAPSASNKQPWTFAVFQGKDRLQGHSARAKAYFLSTEPGDFGSHQLDDTLDDPAFNIFYNANTLVVIYSLSTGTQAAEDCCLAAQNLMLAAHASGLATCPIGLARPWLNLAEVKNELGVPPDLTAIFALTVGYAVAQPQPPLRHAPNIVRWH